MFSYLLPPGGRRMLLACFLLLAGLQARSQDKTYSGKIFDSASGNPVAGVIIKNDRTNATVLSARDGAFKIRARSSDSLLFTHVGYEDYTQIAGSGAIAVRLVVRERTMDDVVIIGYGAVRKKDITGSVGIVNMDDIKKAPVASIDQALAGRIAGVQVTSGEDQPGQAMNITIRGGNSLTQSNEPLYVIDGFPVENPSMSAFNPEDIVSINILKDASATAIYGARGANGVVVIETKSGKTGKPVVSYKASYGFQEVTKRMKLMSPYEFVKYQLEINPSDAPAQYLSNGKTLDDYRGVKGYDWQEELFRRGAMHNHSLSVSGGNAQTKYAVSFSLLDQQGPIINSGFRRYQGRVSLDQTINKKIKAGLRVDYSSQNAYGQLASASSASANSATSYIMYSAWGYRPITGNDSLTLDDTFDPDVAQESDSRINPVVSAKNEIRRNLVKNLMANVYITYAIHPDLQLKITGGLANRDTRFEEFYNSSTTRGNTQIPGNVRGVNGAIRFVERLDWLNENTLTYNKRLGKNRLNVVVGYTMQGITASDYGYSSQNVPNEELGVPGMQQGIPYQSRSGESENILLSYLGRVNYDIKGKYLFTATMRADGSSKFAAGNRWGYFPSGAFAWRMGSEKFMKRLSFISDAKLRISYGLTGNNRVGDFVYMPSIGIPIGNSYSYNNATPSPGAFVDNIGNPNLRWETTEQWDIGYDLSLFNNRINFIADIYQKTTSDLLLNANLPYATGFRTVYKNIGKIRNRGLELTLNTVNIRKPAFSWETSFNIAFNDNKVLALADNEESFRSNVSWTNTYNGSFLYLTKVGGPSAQFFGYVFDGIYQYEDFDQMPNGSWRLKSNVPANGTSRESIQPGDTRYRDMNADGTITDQDMVVIGRTLPVHVGGFTNNFTYKSFQLSVFFQWSYGNHIFNANRIMFDGNESNKVNLNQYASYIDRWTPDNPSNTHFRAGGRGLQGIYSSRTIEDGSYLRLKTVSLSYSLPASVLRKIKVKSLEIFAAAQNLATWTKYTGMDPEVSVRNTVLTPGFDYSAYPRARTITFGLQANF